MAPVAWFVAVTLAFGIEEPVASTTTPVMAPCSTWARQVTADIAVSKSAIRSADLRDIPSPSLMNRPTAIHHQNMTHDHVGQMAAQEQHRSHEVFRLIPTSDRQRLSRRPLLISRPLQDHPPGIGLGD